MCWYVGYHYIVIWQWESVSVYILTADTFTIEFALHKSSIEQVFVDT
jgi:hypothetical protein